MVIIETRRWALGAGPWANKYHHNLTPPLPWRPFDKLKVLSNAEGERTEERGYTITLPFVPSTSTGSVQAVKGGVKIDNQCSNF